MDLTPLPPASTLAPLIFDIETDGLLPSMTKIHCGVIRDTATGTTTRYSPTDIDQMVHVLSSTERPLMGHNVINFDIPAIQKLYPKFQPKALPLDTLIWSQLVTPDVYNLTFSKKQWRLNTPAELFGSHSLKAWGYRLGVLKGTTPDSTWQTYSPEMLDYCAQDTEVTHALWQELQRWTTSESAVHLEMQVAMILRIQETTGVCFDTQGAQHLACKLLDERDSLVTKIREHPTFTPVCTKEFVAKVNNKKLGRTKGDTIRIMEPFNPGSKKQLVEKLQEVYGWNPSVLTDKGNPQMDDEILQDLAQIYPEVELIRQYDTCSKILSYVSTGNQSWLSHVTPEGKIHGNVKSCGAGTRRMTHNSPNLGQVPSVKAYLGKECRALFGPPPGYVMVGIDADQLELRTLSHFMYPFDNGMYAHAAVHGSKENKDDIHWVNARAFKVDRELGKTVFYASIYGAGREKKGRIITKSWDKSKNMAEGARIERSMDKGLPALGMLKEAVLGTLKKRGYLLDLDGQMFRIRSEHSCLNELNQRAGAIIMKRWDVILWDKLVKHGVDFHRLLTVHDEIQLAVRPESVDLVRRLARESFAEVSEFYKLKCPVSGDGKVGGNWSETH